jgi:hypothetical protein
MGWRLPTVEEFISLLVEDSGGATLPPTLPPGHPFTGFPDGTQPWWTATTDASNPTLGWVLYLHTGPIGTGGFNKSTGAHRWCVRGGFGYDGR